MSNRFPNYTVPIHHKEGMGLASITGAAALFFSTNRFLPSIVKHVNHEATKRDIFGFIWKVSCWNYRVSINTHRTISFMHVFFSYICLQSNYGHLCFYPRGDSETVHCKKSKLPMYLVATSAPSLRLRCHAQLFAQRLEWRILQISSDIYMSQNWGTNARTTRRVSYICI